MRPLPAHRYTSLSWRVFAVNALVLLLSGAVVVIVFSPGAISSGVATKELVILVLALAVMLTVNRVLLRRELAPLERVAEAMRRADPLAPGERVPVPSRPSEASDLAVSFNAMTERLEDERRASTDRALRAQEGERLRIAQELHDEVGQQLTATLLRLTSARRQADEPLRPALDEVHQLTRESLEDVRRVARDLRPEALDDLGLSSALAALCERLRSQTGLEVDLSLPAALTSLGDDQELVVYRVAQESLTNVVRHAAIDRARMSLSAHEGELVMEVADRGQGFDPGSVTANGIVGMRERALLVEARLDVVSAPGRGTTVRLALPLEQ